MRQGRLAGHRDAGGPAGGDNGYDGRGEADREERHLLPHGPPRQPAERPEVQQEQDDRQRDARGLREDGSRIHHQGSRAGAPTAHPREPNVHRETREREERRQQCLALRHQGYRLNRQRVEAEQQARGRRHEGASEERLHEGRDQQRVGGMKGKAGLVKRTKVVDPPAPGVIGHQ